jgi:hypothetical protein
MSGVRIADELRVEAPITAVLLAIEDPVAHARWHPFVSQITGTHELGHVRNCSVLIGKKSGHTRERCVEHEARRRVVWEIERDSTGFARMVSAWRAGFTLTERNGATLVTAESSFHPDNLAVRAMLPLIRRKFHNTHQAILRGLKDSVESARLAADASGSRSRS